VRLIAIIIPVALAISVGLVLALFKGADPVSIDLIIKCEQSFLRHYKQSKDVKEVNRTYSRLAFAQNANVTVEEYFSRFPYTKDYPCYHGR